MTYDDIAAIFFAPSAAQHLEPDVPTSPARRLRDALEPIATQGWWSRAAADNMTRLGLDFFGGYVWGRAAALGTPVASTVVSTFGVFESQFLTTAYDSGRSKASRDDVLQAREDGARQSVSSVVTDDEANAIALPLRRALEEVDGCARPLFSGLRELPNPSSPAGQLWRAAEMLREHRGDGHLAVCIAHGLTAVEMNVLTELWLGFTAGDYSSSRSFSREHIAQALESLQQRRITEGDALTDMGRAFRVAIEFDTDRTQDVVVAALGSDIEDVISSANEISARLVSAPSFPTDPRKRAAG